MYGTVARMRVAPGAEGKLLELNRNFQAPKGAVAEYVYRMDTDPSEYYLVVAFESEAAYKANAASPEQHAFYLQFRECLSADPEWHDGTIVDTRTFADVTS